MVDIPFEEVGSGDLTAALVALAEQQRQLREFQAGLGATSVTVRSKDRMLSATFDGSAELTELKFHTTRYREMAPAELANVIVALLTEGRAKAFKAMAEIEGAPTVPGVDLAALASGKVGLDEVMGTLLGPMFGQQSNGTTNNGGENR